MQADRIKTSRKRDIKFKEQEKEEKLRNQSLCYTESHRVKRIERFTEIEKVKVERQRKLDNLN